MTGGVRVLVFVGVALGFALFPLPAAISASRDATEDCFSNDNERRIDGCSRLLEIPNRPNTERSAIYAMRALAYSLKGLYAQALPDYDRAIELKPDFAIALNNRAWALFKSGQAALGVDDVEKALRLSPTSSHAYDTRGHIRHVLGNARGALSDYEQAMRYGGRRMVRLYQCGLQANGLYLGRLDGFITEKLRSALETCVEDARCDPLPAEEECRKVTS